MCFSKEQVVDFIYADVSQQMLEETQMHYQKWHKNVQTDQNLQKLYI